jgi:hypothetical protein
MSGGLARQAAIAFVEGYGRAWEAWDLEGFVALFSEEVVYVVHPTQETVVGSAALAEYVRKEAAAQGSVIVRMGEAMVDGFGVAAEFWVKSSGPDGEVTIIGSLLARLDPASGRCSRFREYWFEVSGHADPFPGWGDQGLLVPGSAGSSAANGRTR